MKTRFLFAVCLLLLLLAPSQGRAEIDRSVISTFTVALQKACDAKDIDAVKALYDFDGVTDVGVDYEIGQWEDFFDYTRDHRLTVMEILFVEKEAYLARANIDQAAVQRQSGPRQRNGTWYHPSLDVVGFALVTSENGTNSTAVTFRVGLDPSGALRLVADVRGAPGSGAPAATPSSTP